MPFVNPNGIASFSPRLARFREGVPWVVSFKFRNPEWVEYQRLTKQIQPLQGCGFFLFSPRVARSSQPWSESFNPVGIENQMAPPEESPGIPPKTSRSLDCSCKDHKEKSLRCFFFAIFVFFCGQFLQFWAYALQIKHLRQFLPASPNPTIFRQIPLAHPAEPCRFGDV